MDATHLSNERPARRSFNAEARATNDIDTDIDTKSPTFQESPIEAEEAKSPFPSPLSFPAHVEAHDIFDGEEDAVDPVYQAKARLLNAAFQEIGMGRYQWWLFFVGGFGWFT